MQKITPFLWFDDKAEEAANYYVSVFRNSKIRSVARYGEAGAEVSGRPEGTVMTVAFELDGQEFIALNGGPQFKFSEAISFVVKCETQGGAAPRRMGPLAGHRPDPPDVPERHPAAAEAAEAAGAENRRNDEVDDVIG